MLHFVWDLEHESIAPSWFSSILIKVQYTDNSLFCVMYRVLLKLNCKYVKRSLDGHVFYASNSCSWWRSLSVDRDLAHMTRTMECIRQRWTHTKCIQLKLILWKLRWTDFRLSVYVPDRVCVISTENISMYLKFFTLFWDMLAGPNRLYLTKHEAR